MSQGPENRYIKSIHDKLPKDLHREKMHNAYRGGTFDVWYSGTEADIWVEYKWQTIPKSGLIVPALSPLQEEWGLARHHEGRHVNVVVGTLKGATISVSPNQWLGAFESKINELATKQYVADWIYWQTMGKPIEHNNKTSKASKRKRVSV